MAKKRTPKLEFDKGWQYDPAPQSAEPANLRKSYDLFINGKFVKPAGGKYFWTSNPANDK